MNQVRRLDFGVHMAVTGIGISDDHLLKILGFRLIPVAAGGHLGSKIANTPPYLKCETHPKGTNNSVRILWLATENMQQ